MSTYYTPTGGLPAQTSLMTQRAVFSRIPFLLGG